jgi:hypothetical protein
LANARARSLHADQAPKPSEDASAGLAIAGQAFAFRELAAATDHFTPYNLIGEGGFFRVYKGQLEKTGQVRAHQQSHIYFIEQRSDHFA